MESVNNSITINNLEENRPKYIAYKLNYGSYHKILVSKIKKYCVNNKIDVSLQTEIIKIIEEENRFKILHKYSTNNIFLCKITKIKNTILDEQQKDDYTEISDSNKNITIKSLWRILKFQKNENKNDYYLLKIEIKAFQYEIDSQDINNGFYNNITSRLDELTLQKRLFNYIEPTYQNYEKLKNIFKVENPNDHLSNIFIRLLILMYYNYSLVRQSPTFQNYVEIKEYPGMNLIAFLFQEFDKQYYKLLNMNYISFSNTVLINHDHFHKNIRLRNCYLFSYQKMYYTNLNFSNISFSHLVPFSNIIRNNIKFKDTLYYNSLVYYSNIKSPDIQTKKYLSIFHNLENHFDNIKLYFDFNNEPYVTSVKLFIKNSSIQKLISTNRYTNLNDTNKTLIEFIFNFTKFISQEETIFNCLNNKKNISFNTKNVTKISKLVLHNYNYIFKGKDNEHKYLKLDDIENQFILDIKKDVKNEMTEENYNNTESLRKYILDNKTFKMNKELFDITNTNKFNKIQINLFDYQKNNILWMESIEDKIKNNQFKFKFNVFKNSFQTQKYCFIKEINNQKYILEKFIDESYEVTELEEYKNNILKEYTIQGGVLCDEVGLGKTVSCIAHLVNRIDIDREDYEENKFHANNLIILPSRLISQWIFEIEKYLVTKNDLKIKKIMSITDVKKMKHIIETNKLNDYDIYIISSNLLTNKNYKKYIEEHQTLIFNIFKIKWNRIIIDEVHEILKADFTHNFIHGYDKYDCLNNKKKLSKSGTELAEIMRDKLNSNFKWCLTATPFENGPKNLINIIKFLLDTNEIDSLFSNDLDIPLGIHSLYELNRLYNAIFRRTKKSDVRNDIQIPIFTEEIKWIEQSNIERNIYNSFKNVNHIRTNTNYTYECNNTEKLKQLFQLCTNICINNEIQTCFENTGTDIMSLVDLNKIMILKFKKDILKNNLNIKQLDRFFEDFKIFLTNFNLIETYVKNKNNDFNESVCKNKKFIITFMENSKRYISHNIRNIYNEFEAIIESQLNIKLDEQSLYDFYDNLIHDTETFVSILNKNDLSTVDKYYFIYKIILKLKNKIKAQNNDKKQIYDKLNQDNQRLQNQIKLFENNDFIKEKTQDPCIICYEEFENEVVVTKCRHIFCGECYKIMSKNKSKFPCPECRSEINTKNINITTKKSIDNYEEEQKNQEEKEKKEKEEQITNDQITSDNLFKNNKQLRNECINKYGSKMTIMIEYLQDILSDEENRVIIFSQYDKMLTIIGKTLDHYNIKNVFCKGQVHHINKRIDTFKRDKSYRVIMLSSEKCNSGSNLTEANHIFLIDVLNMNKSSSMDVESQAIGRAVRLGQKKPVTVTRFITKETIEEEFYNKNKYDIKQLQ